MLIISVASISFAHNGKPNRHSYYDTGAAVAMMCVEATALGLHVHQMAGFEPEKVREAYNVPSNAEPVSAIAIGYLGDPASLSDDLRKKEKRPGTKPLNEFVFAKGWGAKPDWLK